MALTVVEKHEPSPKQVKRDWDRANGGLSATEAHGLGPEFSRAACETWKDQDYAEQDGASGVSSFRGLLGRCTERGCFWGFVNVSFI